MGIKINPVEDKEEEKNIDNSQIDPKEFISSKSPDVNQYKQYIAHKYKTIDSNSTLQS